MERKDPREEEGRGLDTNEEEEVKEEAEEDEREEREEKEEKEEEEEEEEDEDKEAERRVMAERIIESLMCGDPREFGRRGESKRKIDCGRLASIQRQRSKRECRRTDRLTRLWREGLR